jgi:SAM-dependent methyltransferase
MGKKERPDEKNFLDPDFWVTCWEQREELTQKTVNRAFCKPQRWDKLSEDFSRRCEAEQEDPLRDRLLSLLKERAMPGQGVKILDLGCGTGRFTLPFAQMGAQVTAVDVSEKMLHYLKEKTPPEVSSHITCLALNWHEADLDRLGFRAAFDISLAHMTPAITGPETFLKFLSTSRKWCVLVTWTGQRKQNTAEEVWRHFTGRELEQGIGDIIYPFNLLYAMGYRPFLEFQHHRHESSVDPEREADLLSDLFQGYIEGSKEDIRQRSLLFLQAMAEEGKVHKVITGCVGRMIWQV